MADQSQTSAADNEQYAELARAVYAAAKREHWTNEKIFKMLNNPVDFVKYTEAVSHPLFNF